MRMFYINVILLFSVLNGFSQINQASIIYGVKFSNKKKDTINEKYKEAYKKFYKITKQAENIETKLTYNNGFSSFSNLKSMNIGDNQKILLKLAFSFAKLQGKYHINIKDKNITLEKEAGGINYLITSNFDKYEWKLLTDVKKISGFTCYKATSIKTFKSRKGNMVEVPITAWYTPDIPLPLGPKDYAGLPGLALSITEGTITYYAKKIELKPKKAIVESPKKGERVTEKEYAKITEGSVNKWIKQHEN